MFCVTVNINRMAKLSYGGGGGNSAVPGEFLICSKYVQRVFQIYSHQMSALNAGGEVGQQLVHAPPCAAHHGCGLGGVEAVTAQKVDEYVACIHRVLADVGREYCARRHISGSGYCGKNSGKDV